MVLLTIALVMCAVASSWIAARSVRVMRELEEKRSSPYVIIETTQSVPFYGVRIANLGMTSARNVSVEVQPRMETAFSSYKKPISFLERPVPVLVPQKSYACDMGTKNDIKKANPSLRYRCVVRYESEWGQKHESVYMLDYSIYEHLVHREEKTLTDLTKKIEEFCREFGHLASGFHKLHVLTEDYGEHEERIRRAMEEDDPQSRSQDGVDGETAVAS